MKTASLLADLIQPFPGRMGRTLEICLVCTLVVVVSMTFEIPSADVSAYVIFFAAKENSGLNVVTSVVFIIVVTVVVGVLFVLAPLSLNYPTLRIGVIGAVSFGAFFLTSTSKLAAVSGTAGLVTAYGLDLLQGSFVGEITTRSLLYAWLFVAVPMSLFAAYSIAFGRHPEALLRRGLAGRLRLAANALRGQGSKRTLAAAIGGGNATLMGEIGMIKLFRRQPPDTLARLAALTPLTYAMLLTVATLRDDAEAPAELSSRLDGLADSIERLPDLVASAQGGRQPGSVHTLADQAFAMAAAMENIVGGAPMPPGEPPAKKPKAGLFVPDAFSNPEHSRFALKGALAVLVCYLTFNLLDWPGIHTCLITCFIVALKTLGETLQKMILRLVGCLVGAALGLAAIVFVLPQTTSITDLALVIAVATFPAAWIAVGKPSVGYIGFQIGFALFLCILQGTEPKFDLTVARDRVIGILFGNIVIYLIFTRIFPVSILGSVQRDLVQLVARCRAVLTAASDARSEPAAAKDIAEVQTMLGALEGKLLALGLENRHSPMAGPFAQASRRGATALHDVVWDLGRVASYPPPDLGSPDEKVALARSEADLCSALAQAVAPLTQEGKAVEVEKPNPQPDLDRLHEGRPEWAGRIAALRSCRAGIDRLDTAISSYRNLARQETATHA